MARAGVALVVVEPPPGIVVGLGLHDPVAGHLGQDRCRGDRQAAGIAADDPPGDAAADEVPLAVEQDPARRHPQPLQRPPGRQALGLTHPQLVTLLRRGVPDGPRRAPAADAVEQRLALVRQELLGVADLVDPPIPGQHGGTDAEGTGPGTPADLVHADDDVVSGLPHLSLERQRRRPPLQGLAEHRCRRGGHRGRG